MKKITNIKDAQKQQAPQGGEVTVNMDETEPVSCDALECDSEIFRAAHKLRRLSAAHPKNPTKKPQFVPFQTTICSLCGTELKLGK